MPRTNLFSGYRQGENRVTGSLMAVLERLDLESVERVLNAAGGESALLELVRFELQPPGRGRSVPDGCIRADFSLWLETKTVRHAYEHSHARGQLVEHLTNLRTERENDWLIVLTPDVDEPRYLSELADGRVRWISFASLASAFGELLEDANRPSEVVSLLIRELIAMFEDEGLLSSDDVVVVAARYAYPQYLEHGVYLCQAGRPFKEGLTHLAFYAEQEIKTQVPRIQHVVDDVEMTEQGIDALEADGGPVGRSLAERLRGILVSRPERHGQTNKVFLLSLPDESETLCLPAAIPNDLTGKSGKRVAFTMGQRYAATERLVQAAGSGSGTSGL